MWTYMGVEFHRGFDLAMYMLQTGAVEESFGNWMYQEMCPFDVLCDCLDHGASNTLREYRSKYAHVMEKSMCNGEDYTDDDGEPAYWVDDADEETD